MLLCSHRGFLPLDPSEGPSAPAYEREAMAGTGPQSSRPQATSLQHLHPPLPPILQPQGLREQIPYMLVARGRTKEVSWGEVSTVKKELENMPPANPS